MEKNVRFPVQLVHIIIVIIVCDSTWEKVGEKIVLDSENVYV